MASLIQKNGKKINLKQLELNTITELGVLITDDTVLKTLYVLNLYKNHDIAMKSVDNCELIAQISYITTPPSQEQIIYEMVSRGLSRYDFATIETGHMLDYK